ncbi:MAG: hypothetical protein K2X87_13790 [Gemmataceae bacterium]|nr:hypothetical protein [Gemmataceae bacterium]
MTLSRRVGPALFLTTAVLVAAGCSSNPPEQPPPDVTDQNLMHLVQLYSAYQSKHTKKTAKAPAPKPGPGKAAAADPTIPGSADELKTWAKTLPADELQKMGISGGELDGMFVSPRDNQPYGLAKPANAMMAKMGAMKVIFYERDGVDGKHMVVGGMGTRPREITRAELKEAVPEFGG